MRHSVVLAAFAADLLLVAGPLAAATISVGPGRTYASPNALWRAVEADPAVLAPGDVVEIDAGTYRGVDATAVWPADDLLVRAVGGRVTLVADGADVWGKGIFVSAGDRIAFEGFTFVGAAVPDGNGAGIRQDGTGMTVRRCVFRGNENGILSNNEPLGPDGRYRGTLLVEYCVFEGNGAGDGLTHNVYVGRSARCDFRFNTSVGAVVGHAYKSRADTNVVAYNRLADGADGEGSRLVDLSNGGLALVLGNELLQGPRALNRNLVGYGPEGLTSAEAPHRLYVVHNTLVNRRPAGALFVDAAAGSEVVELRNNLVVGPGEFVGAPPTASAGNVVVAVTAEAGFVDEAADDYGLAAASPGVDAGEALATVAAFDLAPAREYVHPAGGVDRGADSGAPDAGAHPLPAALPVTYAAPLTAALTEEGVRLTWRTAEESGCDRFAVERSSGGRDAPGRAFAALDSLACGNAGASYEWLDREPPSETLYYRLRQVDQDGRATLGEIVVVDAVSAVVDAAVAGVDVYGRTLVNLGRRSARVSVFDTGGRRLRERHLPPGGEVDLADLSRGSYVLVAHAGDGSREVLRVTLP